jgi:hypothetical protein
MPVRTWILVNASVAFECFWEASEMTRAVSRDEIPPHRGCVERLLRLRP